MSPDSGTENSCAFIRQKNGTKAGIPCVSVNVITANVYGFACAGLPSEHHEIVTGWKRCRKGTYILERNLKKGSVFISAEDAEVYMVFGLFSAWEEMFGCRPLPVMMETVLQPIRDKIITDRLVIPYNIVFGREAAEDFKDAYMDAKKNGKIRFSL